ncbi:MAG: AMP-binding protein [Sandaracinaceae bacterium]|nr:AMP-binding protein [Sandaracinaceae bacterium]
MMVGFDQRTGGAARSTVASLFRARSREHPARVAVRDDVRALTYAELEDRVRRLAAAWSAAGVVEGDRVAVLSENRIEFLEAFLAAAWTGAIVACQSWRLAEPELRHCLELVRPKLTLVSPTHADRLRGIEAGATWTLGPELDARLAAQAPAGEPAALDPEAALLILYTSGTTGLPKGAVISHRAEIVRNLVVRAEYGLAPSDAFVAWAPMFHLGGAEYSIGTLITGGEVIVVDGFDAERIADVVATRELGWLILMPGVVDRLAEVLEARAIEPAGVRVCGVMPDLVPTADLVRITRLLDAPYANTFGATETGNPPASAGLVARGEAPASLAKRASAFCEIRLVDPDGVDVPDGTPGELWMRGPTLFSGYWVSDEEVPDEEDADQANAESFAGGWFHMGDVFVRQADGSIDFVDRVKYLIKSGGENVYPAEIERVMLADPRVAEAAVVRRADARWGEVPVAFVARRDGALQEADLYAACRAQLAGYKQPKDIRFIAYEEFPRSASGKVVRHELERRLAETAS